MPVLSDRAIPLELDGERGDLGAFSVLDDAADRASIAYIGEMDHFIAEKYEFRLLVIRYLASRGWRWFGEEWDSRRGRRVDEVLHTGDDTLLDPLDEAPWFSRGVLANERQPTVALEAEQRRFMRAVRRVAPEVRWFGFDWERSDTDYIDMANPHVADGSGGSHGLGSHSWARPNALAQWTWHSRASTPARTAGSVVKLARPLMRRVSSTLYWC